MRKTNISDVQEIWEIVWWNFMIFFRPTLGVHNGVGRMYQPFYLAGYTAGLSTSTGVICIIGPYAIPETYRQISAWILGATRANPNVLVHVVWTESWFDPIAEIWVTKQFHQMNCDVISIRANSVDAYRTAASLGMMSTGFNSDYRSIIGESVLASAYFNWGVLYTLIAKMVLNGSAGNTSTHDWWLGWNEGAVGLTDFSFLVPTPVVDAVNQERVRVLQGGLHGDTIFCGPIYTDKYSLAVSSGACMDDQALTSMMWLPRGAVNHGRWVLPGRKCNPGEYGDWDIETRKLTCRKCPAGTFSYNREDVSECRACGVTFYSIPGSANCTLCPPGTYGDSMNMSSCTPCPVGTYASGVGSLSCGKCPAGQQPDPNRVKCVPLEPSKSWWYIPLVVVLGVLVLGSGLVHAAIRTRFHYKKKKALRLAPQGQVSIVFTEIQDLVKLLDALPLTLSDSLSLHNTIMRSVLCKCNGYEVKNEAGVFTIEFSTLESAIDFCIQVQEELLTARWPSKLFGFPGCAAVTTTSNPTAPIFRGLRVRMGIHVGIPQVDYNPETGRVDYFGPVVNCASRLCALSAGGQILVTAETLALVTQEQQSSVEWVSLSLGSFRLKGVSEEKEIFQISSKKLSSRFSPKTPSTSLIPCFFGGFREFPSLIRVRGALMVSPEEHCGRQVCERCLRRIKCSSCLRNAKTHGKASTAGRIAEAARQDPSLSPNATLRKRSSTQPSSSPQLGKSQAGGALHTDSLKSVAPQSPSSLGEV